MKTSSIRKLTLSLAVAISIVSPGILRADLGDNNPTGPSGEFNGSVTTGCSYDPYTGNAHRLITDIVVPGAVGTYPLAFTRTINTRTAYANNSWGAPFGRPGGWRHSYQWEVGTIYMTFTNCVAGGVPVSLHRNLPRWPRGYFRSRWRKHNAGNWRSFCPNSTEDPQATSANCYLLLRDGGRVHFTVTINRNCDDPPPAQTEFVFGFAGIIDPYGQETTISSTIGPYTYYRYS